MLLSRFCHCENVRKGRRKRKISILRSASTSISHLKIGLLDFLFLPAINATSNHIQNFETMALQFLPFFNVFIDLANTAVQPATKKKGEQKGECHIFEFQIKKERFPQRKNMVVFKEAHDLTKSSSQLVIALKFCGLRKPQLYLQQQRF